mgnify:CR=1 FL=1|jgi:RNA polymerase-binding transcription factor DksA
MNMLDQKIIDRLRTDLHSERRALLDLRAVAEASWEGLSPPAREAQEAATREHLRRGVAQLDRVGRERLQKIDAALLKISQDRYGLCESCGRPIAVKRLYAVPEARRCMRCASRKEVRMEGEDAEFDAQTSLDTGEPMTPPDHLGPERV